MVRRIDPLQQEMSAILKQAAAGDAISLARALVATPSVNPELEEGGAGEQEVANLVAGWLEGWGVSVQVSEPSPGRFNVLGRIGKAGTGKVLLLNGHLDTVGIAGMTVDPFGVRIEDGRLWGRGSCDMKGGVAAILAAAALLQRNKPEYGTIYVALTADEENASVGIQAFLEDGLWADGAIVCEPTGLTIMPAHKGFVWIEALFAGNAAHGSRSDIGVDAIEHAAQYLIRVADLRRKLESRQAHPLLGHGSIHAGTITGGSAPSIYPASCKVVLERRTLPGEDITAIMEEFQSALRDLEREVPELSAHLKHTLIRSATEVEAGSMLIERLAKVCNSEKVNPLKLGMTAWVEASFLNEAGIPAICFGPGSIGQAHSDDEWIRVEEIEQCASVLERFARVFLEEQD